MVRWHPAELARPVALPYDTYVVMDDSGFGLALVLDQILGMDRQAFDRLEDRFLQFFPHAQSIVIDIEAGFAAVPQVNAVPGAWRDPQYQRYPGKGVFVRFRGAEQPVAARHLSDGMLLVLGYLATLYHPSPPPLLLIEEPENGIHPRRLGDVVAMLRELVKESATQVILTTHSPYAVSLFEPEEVTLCYRRNDGSVGTKRLSESGLVARYSDLFTLGEIWTGEGDQALAEDPTAIDFDPRGFGPFAAGVRRMGELLAQRGDP